MYNFNYLKKWIFTSDTFLSDSLFQLKYRHVLENMKHNGNQI